MRRNSLFLGLALVASIALVSCKSSESNYRKAYEKAKAEEQNRQETEPVAVTPVVTPVQTQQTQTINQDASNLRQEKLNVQNGGVLKAFNVVCGSFKSIDNANNLRNTLVNQATAHRLHRIPILACIVSSPHRSTTGTLPRPHAMPCALNIQTLGSSIGHTKKGGLKKFSEFP